MGYRAEDIEVSVRCSCLPGETFVSGNLKPLLLGRQGVGTARDGGYCARNVGGSGFHVRARRALTTVAKHATRGLKACLALDYRANGMTKSLAAVTHRVRPGQCRLDAAVQGVKSSTRHPVRLLRMLATSASLWCLRASLWLVMRLLVSDVGNWGIRQH